MTVPTPTSCGQIHTSRCGQSDRLDRQPRTITASNAGFAALCGPRRAQLRHHHSHTRHGRSGVIRNGFSLDFYGDKLITLNVNDQIAATVKDVATGQSLNNLVSNSGTLSANGGRVELTAVRRGRSVDSVINNTGVLEPILSATQTA